MQNHTLYMRRCLDLAALGAGSVSPNPMVGAVIVHENQILGEGWHRQYGEAHAEVNAVEQVLENYGSRAEELLKKSTLYVNLEPCSHQGKTPPCVDLIIKHQIPEVVVGCRDVSEKVDGRGIERLRSAGVQVHEGILEREAQYINRRFFTQTCKKRSYIILKWAETTDGYFAPADLKQKWISNKQSQLLTHRWRSEEDAILVGKNTALADNPRLNTRLWDGKSPKRIVLDRNLELPDHLHLFDQSIETIVLNEKKTDIQGNLKYISLESFDFYLAESISFQLYLLDIQSVIVEGGAKTLELFIKAGLWDEARVFTADTTWGEGTPAPRLHAKASDSLKLGTNKLTTYLRK